MAETYTETRLILCEGDSDNAFFRKLLDRRGIGGFQVIDSAQGQDKFDTRLRSIRANRDFPKLTSILIVSDNDNDTKAAFRRVTNQISAVGGYGVPRKRRTPKRAVQHPAISVLMLPWDHRVGCLETVINEAILHEYPEIEPCLNDYARCTGANRWDKSKRDKMRLHSLVSAICQTDPACAASYMWKDTKGFQDLLDAAPFNQLADFLRNFPVA